jgi:hypothetical protein
MKYKSVAYLFMLLILSSACTLKKQDVKIDRILGVKLYDYQEDFKQLFENLEAIGINTIFASPELLSSENFIPLSRSNGFKTFVILPIFYAPELLEKDPGFYAINQFGEPAGKEWVQFVCPSNEQFINLKIDYIKKFVNENEPDGISLDFIRHFAFWEKIYEDTSIQSVQNTCFDTNCLSGFSQKLNIEIPKELTATIDIYGWIKQNHFDEWVSWKNDLISSTVHRIVSEVKVDHPEIIVNLHAVPWRKGDFNNGINNIIGQDFETLSKYVDYISPMTYSHMLKRDPDWIHSVVNDVNSNIEGAKILPSIQVGKAYLSNELSPEEFEACLLAALKEPSSGVIFWNWDMLAASKEKMLLAKTILK